MRAGLRIAEKLGEMIGEIVRYRLLNTPCLVVGLVPRVVEDPHEHVLDEIVPSENALGDLPTFRRESDTAVLVLVDQ